MNDHSMALVNDHSMALVNDHSMALRKKLLAGVSALALAVAVGAAGTIAVSTSAQAAEVLSDSSRDWDAAAADFAGVDADNLKYDGADTITVDDAQDIGAVGAVAVTGNSVDFDGQAAILVFSGGTATGSIIHGTIINTSGGGSLSIEFGEAAAAAGAGAAKLSVYGDVVAGTDISHQGTGDSTLTLGNGTTGMTFSGTISLNEDGSGGATIINLAASSTIAGTIDFATAGGDGGTSVTINMAAGSSITGATQDTAQATLITVNVDGDATIGSGTNAWDNGTTTDTIVAVDSGMTLTLAGTGAWTGIDVDFDLAGTATLKVTGAKSITATIDGTGAGTATLDIDAATTVTGAIGDAFALAAVDIADGIVLTAVGNVDATTITLGSTTGVAAELKLTAASTVTGNIEGVVAGQGILNIDEDVTVVGSIGGTTGIATINVIDGKTLTIDATNGNVTVNATSFVIEDTAGDNAGLTLAAQTNTITITNAITMGAAGGEGLITLQDAGTVNFSADVGTAANSLSIMTGTANEVTNITAAGNLYIDALDIEGELQLDGSDKVVSGTIDSVDTDNVGTIDINGTTTFNGAIGGNDELAGITLATGKTATFEGNVDMDTADLAMESTGATVVFGKADSGGNSSITVIADITGTGTLTLTGDDTDAVGHVITGAVGTSGTPLTLVNVGLDNDDSATATDTHTISDDLYATSVVFQAANNSGSTTVGGTLTLIGSAVTTSSIGSITTAVSGDGTFELDAIGAAVTATVTGNIGTSSLPLLHVRIDGDNGNIATLNAQGNIYATTIELQDASEGLLNLSGSSAQIISGTIDAETAGDGIIDVVNTAGTVTFQGAIGDTNQVAEVEVSASATAVFESTVDAVLIDLDGTGQFDVDTNVATTLDLADGSTIILGSGIVTTETAISGTTFTTTGTDAQVTVEMPANFLSGAVRLFHDTNAGSTYDAADFVITDTVLVNYTIAAGAGGNGLFDEDNQDLIITASKNSTASIASSLGVTTSAASALSNGVTAALSDATVLAAYTTALNAGGAEATLAAEQSQNSPAALGASSAIAASVGTQVFGVGTARLASLREGATYASAAGTGFATGNEGLGSSVWIRPFAYFADQDARGGIAGYEAETFGVAAGVDTKFGEADNWTAGLALSYANSDIDGEDAGNSDTGIDSYQATLYGDYTTSRWYVEGLVGFARNNVDTARQLTFGGLNRTAKGDYSSDQYMAYVGTGVPIEVGSNSFLTPHVGFQYTHVDSDSYTETGAGVLNLTVNPEDLDIALGIVGARYHFNIPTADGTMTPEIRGSLLYDFAGDEAQSTSTFTGGGAPFQVAGADVAQLGGSFGAGLSYTTQDGRMTFGANYDAELKEDFIGHAGRLEFKLHF